MRRLLPTILLAAIPGTLHAQAHSGAFVVRLGNDTIAVERFSRQGSEYSVEQVRRVPRTSLWHTHIGLAPSGEVGEIFLMNHSIERMDAPLLASVRLVARGDRATVESKRGDSTRTRSLVVGGGAIPSLPQSFLTYELAAMRMRRTAADSATVVLLSPAGDTSSIVVRRVGADSMTFQLPFFTYRAKVDGEGRIASLYQPLGTTVERVPAVDVNAIAKAWATLDAAGKAMGPLSPYDSTTARVGAATVTVRYSRPRARGRVVYGNLVAYDKVWRTGANAATVLETDRDLVIGATPVPAGRYTLFTIPSRTSTTLVISRETTRNGQPLSGLDYDPAQDLARIPMTTRTIARPVDQVTFGLVPARANAATLHVVWDRREMTVPVRTK
jgi:hypothetical protein